jgi:hypothetical protein
MEKEDLLWAFGSVELEYMRSDLVKFMWSLKEGQRDMASVMRVYLRYPRLTEIVRPAATWHPCWKDTTYLLLKVTALHTVVDRTLCERAARDRRSVLACLLSKPKKKKK